MEGVSCQAVWVTYFAGKKYRWHACGHQNAGGHGRVQKLIFVYRPEWPFREVTDASAPNRVLAGCCYSDGHQSHSPCPILAARNHGPVPELECCLCATDTADGPHPTAARGRSL